MPQLRFMILNYSTEDRIFHIGNPGAEIQIYRCSPDLVASDAKAPYAPALFARRGQTTRCHVAAGSICGFIVESDKEVTLTIENPDDKLLILTAVDKNPWPPPPLRPANYGPDDFETRYRCFNRGNAGGALAPCKIRYIPMPAASTTPAGGLP